MDAVDDNAAILHCWCSEQEVALWKLDPRNMCSEYAKVISYPYHIPNPAVIS